MPVNRALFSSANDFWRTPAKVYEALDNEFHFDFDPCPVNPTFDGLNIEWGQCNFVNPPYSRKCLKLWYAKAWQEYQKGKTVVMLVPARTDVPHWHEYAMKATEIRFCRGRIHFNDAKTGAPFPSAIVIFKVTPCQ